MYLLDYIKKIKKYRTALAKFLHVVNSLGREGLNKICARDETDFLENLMIFKDNIPQVAEMSQDAIPYFIECDVYYDMYAETIEQTTCTNIVRENGIMSFILIILAFCSLLILSLRASFYKSKEVVVDESLEEEEDDEERKHLSPTCSGSEDYSDSEHSSSSEEDYYSDENSHLT